MSEPGPALADLILRRIAERYKNCEIKIFPDLPELSPVEAVLRCAREEGFVLTNRPASAAPQATGGLRELVEKWHRIGALAPCICGTVFEINGKCLAKTHVDQATIEFQSNTPAAKPPKEQL